MVLQKCNVISVFSVFGIPMTLSSLHLPLVKIHEHSWIEHSRELKILQRLYLIFHNLVAHVR